MLSRDTETKRVEEMCKIFYFLAFARHGVNMVEDRPRSASAQLSTSIPRQLAVVPSTTFLGSSFSTVTFVSSPAPSSNPLSPFPSSATFILS